MLAQAGLNELKFSHGFCFFHFIFGRWSNAFNVFFASLVVQNYLDTAIRLTDYSMADYG